MGETLSAVWEQVSALLAAGVSVIPVRDKEVDGKPPKTPYAQWKQYQTKIIQPQELWRQMEHHNTNAVAIICGTISGNLEAIDIDVKNWPGIDGMLFSAIYNIYPDLWEKLRIHSTPSGGFHILYRCSAVIGAGNLKLATAYNSTQAGIETRGEGGYIVAPPSLGYQVYQDEPIPTITLDQRESLINLARSFNEKIKVIEPLTVTKNKTDYYDENPFEHYNNAGAGDNILLDHGWKQDSCTGTHRYFTRPGKDKGISASFNRSTRMYYLFTTSTGLEAERGYHPATILSILQFGGDKKATYEWLVNNGYGKIKPAIEQRLVRSRVLAGDELPANASPGAKVIYMETKQRMETTYPHGVYWVQEDDGIVKINRERLYHVAEHLGFRFFKDAAVQLDGYIIRRVNARYFYDTVKEYIREEQADFQEAVRNAFEAFIQRAGAFTITRLPLLDETHIMASSKVQSFKFYKNGFAVITKDVQNFFPYTKIKPGWVFWEHQILQRDFVPMPANADGTTSLYYQFLDKAVGVTDDLWQLIGYLAHDFKDETMGYIIVLVEACEDPKQGGGTGKNLFCNLLGHITTFKSIAGVQVQLNEKFLQAWNFERVMALSDLPKHFNFAFLKELSMGVGIRKLLFKDEVTIPSHEMPKLVVSTNYSYESVDGGLKRRIRPIEFSDFFTKSGGVDKHFGKLFPYDWNAWEWSAFDYYMHMSIQKYLNSDGKVDAAVLSETGWIKQFDHTYMLITRIYIQEQWEYWMRVGFITNEQFKTQYDMYCQGNGVHMKFRLTSYRLNLAIDDWCSHNGVYFNKDAIQRPMGIISRGKQFVFDRITKTT